MARLTLIFATNNTEIVLKFSFHSTLSLKAGEKKVIIDEDARKILYSENIERKTGDKKEEKLGGPDNGNKLLAHKRLG